VLFVGREGRTRKRAAAHVVDVPAFMAAELVPFDELVEAPVGLAEVESVLSASCDNKTSRQQHVRFSTNTRINSAQTK